MSRQHLGLRARSLAIGCALSIAASFLALAPASAGRPAPGNTGNTGDILPPEAAQSTLVQDPGWLALKTAGQLRPAAGGGLAAVPGGAAATAATAYPTSFNLDLSISPNIVEPEGAGFDDLHHSFYDANYWNFCSAGAAAAVISYFKPTSVRSWPAGYFTEPYGPYRATTFWRSQDSGSSADTGNGYSSIGRAYTMYIAEQVRPPTFGRPGLINFNQYPNQGGSILDQRDVINWEISGHGSDWQNYYYAWRNTDAMTSAMFKNVVKMMIYDGRAPMLLAVWTYLDSTNRLPNWNRQVKHSITLIGYNETTGTYRYVDTCGRNCGSISNGGVHDVSQTVMWTLLSSLGYGFLF
jgi:hypothetical protein